MTHLRQRSCLIPGCKASHSCTCGIGSKGVDLPRRGTPAFIPVGVYRFELPVWSGLLRPLFRPSWLQA